MDVMGILIIVAFFGDKNLFLRIFHVIVLFYFIVTIYKLFLM